MRHKSLTRVRSHTFHSRTNSIFDATMRASKIIAFIEIIYVRISGHRRVNKPQGICLRWMATVRHISFQLHFVFKFTNSTVTHCLLMHKIKTKERIKWKENRPNGGCTFVCTFIRQFKSIAARHEITITGVCDVVFCARGHLICRSSTIHATAASF